MMPDMSGYELCRKLKLNNNTSDIPIIFLTAKTDSEDIVKGFEAGGVDYVTKPFNTAELLARIKTHIQLNLLKSILPVCSNCSQIRDEDKGWMNLENYISEATDTKFSHSMCPECIKKLYPEIADEILAKYNN
jgi:DNA-binding response OmpR family regulator